MTYKLYPKLDAGYRSRISHALKQCSETGRCSPNEIAHLRGCTLTHNAHTTASGWVFPTKQDASAFLTRQMCRHVVLLLSGKRADKEYITRLVKAVEDSSP